MESPWSLNFALFLGHMWNLKIICLSQLIDIAWKVLAPDFQQGDIYIFSCGEHELKTPWTTKECDVVTSFISKINVPKEDPVNVRISCNISESDCVVGFIVGYIIAQTFKAVTEESIHIFNAGDDPLIIKQVRLSIIIVA